MYRDPNIVPLPWRTSACLVGEGRTTSAPEDSTGSAGSIPLIRRIRYLLEIRESRLLFVPAGEKMLARECLNLGGITRADSKKKTIVAILIAVPIFYTPPRTSLPPSLPLHSNNL
jgi:hypothetical protein